MKYVYLDQMHWVALLKAEKGRSDGADFIEVLGAVKDAVATRRAVFPLSHAHMMETARVPRPQQRVELAGLMTRLSMGVVLRRSRPTVEFQLRNAVRRMFGQPLLEPEPSPFGRGVEDASCFDVWNLPDMTPERAARLRSLLDAPNAWIDLLSYKNEASRKAAITSVDRIGREAVDEYTHRRKIWAGADAKLTRRAYGVLLTKTFWVKLQLFLREVGHTVDEWGNAGPQRLMEFWESIPALHVEMELATQMDRQRSKPWTTHDDRDIAFLSLAIPACDVVVTEAYWVDLARRRKLDLRYGTVLLSDLRDLPRHIQST